MPGVGSLPADSVGLAVINQASVEAFLLGANHELARELIWREYPADPAGTWLRTFWDSGGAAQDIPPVARLDARARSAPTDRRRDDPDQVLVLVIKGDLLRRYPNTLVTAVPGQMGGRRFARRSDPAGSARSDLQRLARARRRLPRLRVRRGRRRGRRRPRLADPRAKLPGWYFAFEEPPTEPSLRPRHPGLRRDATGARLLEGPHLGRRAPLPETTRT